MAGTRVLLVSPVRNEAANLDRTARALAAQTRRPDAWLVVDDSSRDGTTEIAERLAGEIDFMTALRAPVLKERGNAIRDQLALAGEARAFNWALARSPLPHFDYVGKLDGDMELPPDYLERLLARMDADPGLGIAGGSIVEPHGAEWRRVTIPSYHVHGALKMYRRECFEALGGIEERLGWDTIDETYARMLGFRTHTFDDLVVRHHRPSATADGALRGRARHGRCAYIVRYSPFWMVLRSAKVATSRPVGISGVAFLYGYLAAAVRRVPRVEDRQFKRFVRGELRARLLRPLLRQSGAIASGRQ